MERDAMSVPTVGRKRHIQEVGITKDQPVSGRQVIIKHRGRRGQQLGRSHDFELDLETSRR